MSFRVEGGGPDLESHAWVSDEAPISGSVRPAFAPGGHRVAWIMLVSTRGEAPPEPLVAFSPTRGPRIELRAENGLLDRAVPRVAERLEKGGFYPTSAHRADQARTTSEVYVKDGYAEAGERIAKLVPGGARVRPLDWKSEFPVIVAIGSSAGR